MILSIEERIAIRDKIFSILKEKSIIYYNSKWNRYMLPANRSRLYKELESNIELSKLYNLFTSQFTSEKEAEYCYMHNDDPSKHLCPVCNSIVLFYKDKFHSGYPKTCGRKECIVAMTHTDEARDKCKQTCLERYGAEYILQTEYGKKKYKSTCKKRYGVEYPAQNKEIYSKVEQTNLQRYGFKCSAKAQKVKEKYKQTCLERYGAECSLYSTKIRQLICERYGTNSFSQRNITNYSIYSDDIKFSTFIVEQYKKKGMFLRLDEIANFFNVWPDTIHNKIRLLNLEQYFQIKGSSLEIEFIKFLESNGISISSKDRRNRSIIVNENTGNYLEIDFVIPNTNICIEINDIGTHNSLNSNNSKYKDKYYHYYKSIKALEQGFNLIHIWEWELKNSSIWDKLSAWLLNQFNNNLTTIVYNSSFTIKQITNLGEERDFLEKYNLYGYIDSDICLGLYYNNNLIQILSFKENIYSYELLRMSTKYGYLVKNGYKELLNYFINSYNPSYIVAYNYLDKIDKLINYKDLGFELSYTYDPTIVWCNKSSEFYYDYNSNLSFIDNSKNGYIPIYNCGIAMYEYSKIV